MSAIFLAVLELSFKASFLILAVAILRLVLKKAPRRIICALWLLVGLRLIVPFSVESALSLVPSAPNFDSESAEAEIIPEPTPQAAFTPSTEADLSLPQTAPNTQITIPTEPPQLPAVERLPEPEASEPPAAKPLPSRENVAAIVWLSGLGAMLIYLALSFVFLHRSLREAVPAGNGVWKCGAVSSPFVLGIFKPRVYISYGMSPEQTEYVLAHERSHIARRDHWTKLIAFLILSVHWFNPLVWLGYVLLCRDIELACDERVVRSMDEMERKAYSLALLQCAVKASPLAACPLAFGEVGVKQRIKSVLSYKKPTVWIILAAIICGIAAGVFFLTDPKVTKLDCPVEVESAIYDYLDNNASFRRYNVDKVTERNEYLYSFAFTGKLSRSHNADYFAKLGYFRAQRDVSTVYYVYSIDGQWIVTREFSDIPAHILRGEEAAAEAPPTYDCPDMVLETYKRWVKAMSDGTGDFEVYRELTYLGEGVEPSSMGISMADILTDEIQSVTKVNDYLYEVKSIYTLKHSDKEYAAQRFVGYINNKWMLMHYDLVPESLQVGLEYFEHYTWDENGKAIILPPLVSHSGQKGNVSEFPLTDIYPDTPVGIGVNLIYDDENIVVFQAEHGLFVYSLAERRMVLAIDTVKAVGIAGYQGSIPVAGVRVSPDGNTIQLYHTSHKEQCFYIDACSGDYYVAPYEEFPDKDSGDRVIDRKSFIESYGVTVGCFADQYYGAHRGTGERIPLFADFPFATTATAELPVEAHIMDKLRFYLPGGWSTGFYDLFLSGTGSGVAIYDANGDTIGSMELSFTVKPEFNDGEIVFADDGENHASFMEPFTRIDHSLPCAIGRHERDNGSSNWFIVFASPLQKDFCYVLRLDTQWVDRATAIAIAKTVRPTAWSFEQPDQSEIPYWPIIDAYASSVAAGLEPMEFAELGLSPTVAIAANEMSASASLELCYDIWDFDGDGQKELHINTSCNTDSFYYAMLMALFTIDDRGEVVKVLESSERSRYCYAGGSRLVYHGASSAFDSVDEMYRYEKGKLIFDGNAPEEGGFPIRIAMRSIGIRPFSRIDLPYSPASPTDPYVDISSYTGLSIYTPETGYTYAIDAEAYIAQMAAIIGSGEFGLIDESEYMEAAASAPVTLLFESRNVGESVGLLVSPVSTYPMLCVETSEGCFYYNVAGDGLQPARELITYASEFSVNGSSFYYRVPELGLLEYDMSEYVANMDVISSARAVKDKVVLVCHTGPKNGVYLVFDTQSRSFEKEIIGTNLTWYGDMLASSVYSFWEGVYNYHGRLIKEYELMEDEFIRSLEFSENGKSLIVSIEGGGIIRQDIIPILNDNTPGLSMEADLDMDGSDDSISLHADGGLYINGKVFLTGLNIADMGSLSLYTADIDPKDSFLELAISRGGSDAETLFFRWNGQDVLYLGSIPAEYGDIEFCEAYCVAAFHCEILPNWMLHGHWVLQDGELMLTNGMNSGMHYLFSRSSYELNEQGNPVPHRLKDSIVVYAGNEKPTNREVLPADSTIALMGCDNVEWLRIMSDNGASYWLHVANGMVDTPNGPRPIGEIIEGLA